MSLKCRKITKATKVQESIREDIIGGVFSPGEKLQMETLKERYGVGYSPLREALSRLASNGLVQLEEQCGFSVAPQSLTELYDLYHIRAYIEALALELSIRHGDDNWEAGVVASWHCFSKYLDPRKNKNIVTSEWERLQKDFFYALVKGCQSPWLLKINEMLYDQASRYRRICITNHSNNEKLLNKYLKEKKQLVDAVLARDIDLTIKMSKTNWDNTVKVIAKALQDKSKR